MDEPRQTLGPANLRILAEALEASWDHLTAYNGVFRPNNPALGQCYPTSRVVQHFYPDFEIARGEVWTGVSIERHFWNVRRTGERLQLVDLSWQQFPPGSVWQRFEILDRNALGDREETKVRCNLLLARVVEYLTNLEERLSTKSADHPSRTFANDTRHACS